MGCSMCVKKQEPAEREEPQDRVLETYPTSQSVDQTEPEFSVTVQQGSSQDMSYQD